MQFPHNIRALASKGDMTFAAVKSTIMECKRVHKCVLLSCFACNLLQAALSKAEWMSGISRAA